MYKQNDQLIFSPSDLVGFTHSEFASWMDRLRVERPERAPEPDAADSITQLLFAKGEFHEAAMLDAFAVQGLTVANLSLNLPGRDASFVHKQQATIDAMQAGADVVYQAALELLPFRGFADFLIKVPNQPGQISSLGDHHYEVWDTKLSRSLKPSFMIQLCVYAEMLERLQGIRPIHIVVALGNGKRERLLTNDYFYYYSALKQRFLRLHEQWDTTQMPDPAASKTYGRWASFAEELLIERNHLSLIANISYSQIKKLNDVGIFTCAELISSAITHITNINPGVFSTLKDQARIQQLSAGKMPPLFEVLTPKNAGLALLPPHSPLDVFFDIEGFPLADGGLEYLWGATYFDDQDNRQFIDFWAHNSAQEKIAFKGFVEWAYARWQQDPKMHIYHYANYEIAACRKLMGRYGVCEHEVDQLLRNNVFVDLYKIVKAGVLLGESRYSIKNVEHLYRGKRETEVGSGGDSIVVYEKWREAFAEGKETDDWRSCKILKDIRDYNIDDCNSTQELTDWLRAQQEKNKISYIGIKDVEEPVVSDEVNARTQLRDKLLAKTQGLQGDDARITENMAWTLEFHRRETKPMWWRLFDRMGLSHMELENDLDCVASCVRTSREPFKQSDRARHYCYEYKFDTNQEYKPLKSDSAYLLGPNLDKAALVSDECDFNNGIVVVKCKDEPEQIISLIPDEYIAPGAIQLAIDDVVTDFDAGNLYGTAIDDFLYRKKPRIKNHAGGDIVNATDSDARLRQIINTVIHLNNSYLTLQGPPGAGKTHTGKYIIAELVKQGKKIGISSNSHKAINNLLIGAAEYCREQNIHAKCFCTKDTGDEIAANNITVIDNRSIANHLVPGCVIGTTAWGFCREELKGGFDYLFIDEAGQVSVAKLIGMSRAASNIILMGDQMQLGQPSQGSHPAESGLSILDYLLHDSPIIPADIGVFLDTTYRMHSAVNHYISNAIYQGQLKSHPDNDKQVIGVPAGYVGLLNQEAGVIFIPVEHQGNAQASDEEVAEIKLMVNELIGRQISDKNGNTKSIGLSDMLFVAPYNHQVNKLKIVLGDEAKVGSVDKFQGQEAPIVFFSLCSSDANESARGMDFLFDKHRINVAISRAQSLAIVVGNPALMSTKVGSVEQMAKVNVLARLLNLS